MTTASLDEHRNLIDRLFCRDGAPFGGYSCVGDPVVVVTDRLVRATLQPNGDDDTRYDLFQLTIFCDIHKFAGELWEHAARNLLRVGALNHPALPRIVLGKFVPAERVAFTLTRERGMPITMDDSISMFQGAPLKALDHFSLLLDALSELHGAGIMHRNLTAAALNVQQLDPDDPYDVAITLSRFEMSTLIGNVIRNVGARETGDAADSARQFYTTPPPGVTQARHHAYLATELHAYLFEERASIRRDWVSTDVFGLGVIAWEWFCGQIDVVLPGPYAGLEAAQGPQRAAALHDLHVAMVGYLGTSGLPDALVHTLRRMLDPFPRTRFTSFEAAKHLETHWETIRAHWIAETATVPRLVAFMPEESEMLHQERQWIQHSPTGKAGREELQAFLEKELTSAELVHAPNGALGYASGPVDRLREAEWVLVGERAVWFCAVLHDYQAMTGKRRLYHEVLVIKYLREKDITRELVYAKRRRKVESIQLVPFRPGQDLTGVLVGRPKWTHLEEAVRDHLGSDGPNAMYLRSLQFLLDYQRAEVDSRCYAFRRVGPNARGQVVLELDSEADDYRRHSDWLLTAYCGDPRRRPPLGDFVHALDSEKGFTQVDLVPRSGRHPYFSRSSTVTAGFLRWVNESAIRVQAPPGAEIPETGWIRPHGDGGTTPQLNRQERALTLLKAQPMLVEALRAPRSFDLGRGRWLEPTIPEERKLSLESRKTMATMLGTHPFYALQGPPGAGKSTLTVAAIKKNLEAEKGARILVSSQSNQTLDGLARKLIDGQGPHSLILRETSLGDAQKVTDEVVKRHTLPNLTADVANTVTAVLGARLERGSEEEPPYQDRPYDAGTLRLARKRGIALDDLPPLTGELRKLAGEWLGHVGSDLMELTERVRAGASVVLATCNIAATINEGRWNPKDLFDWVIVEEAAKAWPTEIVVPLVLGVRWTLIGDHRQLGPHRQDAFDTFLTSLDKHQDSPAKTEFENQEFHRRALRMFEHFFDGKTASDYTAADSAVGRLEKQFRMVKTIAEPVSRTFYPAVPRKVDADGLPLSFLTTTKVMPHGVVYPEFLMARPLVWIDTADCEGFEEQPRWFNTGEVDLVERLALSLTPVSAPPKDLKADNSLVVLTPYAAQVALLAERPALAGREHTVHSFQGAEADRVIVSLVRSGPRSAPGPEALVTQPSTVNRVGHVSQPELINVLLSRAKRLLVIVGDRQHFTAHGGEDWRQIADVIDRYGVVVPASEVME
ncbi:AAA domain-containing protein [Streptomyces sp. RKAG293]|uniref:DEAD/DEAH box helicase n=1 Tax=Streptomyces sp. RKAG293 TaxID=2893403 RepID=UPI0020348A24|nr:AAA domain-containing protein [Streptomyces sp. RKAG293]MCM2422855.1 AAA domain-containing protein [Streptomyces sp. RKAG293]